MGTVLTVPNARMQVIFDSLISFIHFGCDSK